MEKKIFVLLIFVIVVRGVLYAQVPPPTLLPDEKWTGLYSATYDYQTNGSVRYLLQDPTTPANLFAIMMACEDSTDVTFSYRYIYYSYSSNYGQTWQDIGQISTSRSGFPEASLVNGVPIVTFHVGSGSSVYPVVFKDASWGAYSFTPNNPPNNPPAVTWNHIAGNPSGTQFVVAGSLYGSGTGPFPLYRITYNGTSYGPWTPVGSIGGPSGQASVAYGTGGNVAIFGFAYDSSTVNGATNSTIWMYKSTNNGSTFDNGTVVFRYVVEGADTIVHYITGGFQGMFVGTEPHLIFGADSWAGPLQIGSNSYTLWYIKNRLYHWSPSTGLSVIADNTNSPFITDTITQTLIEPRSNVSIGRLASGKLVCAFTGYPRGQLQHVDNGDWVNTGDIYVSISTNNGLTWSIPINWTNNPNIEEKHPTVLQNSSDDTVRIYYIRDMKAGSFVTVAGWGHAPVYGIYKREYFSFSGVDPVSQTALRFRLDQNYPNPFNPVTTINYIIARNSFVTLKVYDILGREVRTLVNENQAAGTKTIQFDASELASGVYMYKLIAGEFVDTKKMILVK